MFEDMVWRCISKQRTLKVPSWVGLSLILWCSTRNEATRETTVAVISSHSPSPSIPLVNATTVEAASLTITSFSVPRPTPTPHLNETVPERGITSDRVILLSTTITVSLVILTVVSVVVVVLICVICRRMRSSKTVFRGMCLFFLCLYVVSQASHIFPAGGARGKEKHVWTLWPASSATKECNNCCRSTARYANLNIYPAMSLCVTV